MYKGIPKTALLLIAIVCLTACETKTTTSFSLIDWVPQNTIWVAQLNDLESFKTQERNNPLANQLRPLFASVQEDIETTLPKNPENQALLFLTRYGKAQIATSYVDKHPFDSLFLALPKKEYNGRTIYLEKQDEHTIFTSFVDGFRIRSTTQLILENCIRNFENDAKAVSSPFFYELVNTVNKGSALNLFIQPREESLLSSLIPETPLFPKTGFEWNTYDIDFTEKSIEWDGLVQLVDSIGDPLGILKDSQPQKSLIDQITPANATSMLSLPLDNTQVIEDQFRKWVQQRNIPLATIDLEALSSVDEIGWIQLKKELGIAFHLKNELRASQLFLPDSPQEEFRNTPYYPTRLAKDVQVFLSTLGKTPAIQWVCKIDDFLLFAESEGGLKELISAYKEGKTLAESKRYQAFKENLSQKNSFLWVANTKTLLEYWENNFPNKAESLSEFDHKTYPYAAYQGVAESDFMHLYLRIHNSSITKQEGTVEQKILLQLEAQAQQAPQWLYNHRTKRKDIAIQDRNNTLYLFSDQGKLFWKKELEGSIQGKIQQVDLFKNKRLQMAFRTEKKLYVLDRNGKRVNPFPLNLSDDGPIQPLAVFDYDKNRNYRFLVSQGNRLQMYDGKGKKVNGFSFKKTKSNVLNAPIHVRIKRKDYIVVQEENGQLHILNRTGKTRIKVPEKINFSGNKMYSYLNLFTTTDTDGNLVQIDTKGGRVSTPLGVAADHKVSCTEKSLVSLSGNMLTIKGIPVTLPYGTYTDPQIFYLQNILYISVTDIESEKVYLFYSNGTAVQGFPVYGTSGIDLTNADQDKALEMVVLSEKDGILVYEINP